MSPVFGHGRLRLYLLKLLEESPRHGYEIIRLLQDRFLGVYSPSPGTIYPRLARLEDEGLVTHEVVDGKKVFTLTDKGRAEINDRMDELADLEQEITASVQDIAREVKEDVRQTVRSLREELTQMARDIGHDNRDLRREQKEEWRRQRDHAKEEWRRHKRQWKEESERWQQEWRRIWEESWGFGGGRQGDHDAALSRMLADFVADVHRSSGGGVPGEQALAECRAALDEAAERIRRALHP
ncbi:helix-turn-helix transcriptional regulator [Microbispora hainanensis]|jgi:DNA-binding PadR family transcriptional regulator|uniref:PadR family transcriptional regulator n=1 Tax=Microbispora TaxID=2005 RepID=UPI0011C6F33B|nr:MULTISPECIES: PadR family transcriptional regulator [Microbispora]